NSIKTDTRLKTEKPVDGRTYEQEVSRISKYLRNNGYYDFYPSYIAPLSGDSLEHRVKIDLEVLPPNKGTLHQTYELGELTVYPQLILSDSVKYYTDTIIDGVTFKLPNGEDFLVKPRVILSNIFMENGDLFAQSAKDRTNAALGKLGVYKIINILERRDLEQSNVLNVDIRLTPRKALEFGADGDVNTSSTTLLGGRFFGAGAGLLIKDRNLFSGAELLVINSNLNFDFDVSQFDNIDSLVNTLDFKIQADIYLPKFVDYLGLWKTLNRLNLANDGFYERLKEKSSTRLSLSYNYVDRFGFYRLNSLNGSFGYEIPQTNTSRYSITHFGLNFFSPIIEDGLTSILESNPFFARTFAERQLFTGALLRDFEYTYTSPINRKGENFSFTGGVEFSGAEVLAVNNIYNAFAEEDVIFEIKGSAEPIAFSQFTVLEADGRLYRQLSQTQQFVFRLYAGAGIPFGNSTDVPYVKQFYTGGPYSIRGWRARELGPGGYVDPATQGPNANPLVFSQTGNFKLEANAEYRFNMFDLFGFEWDGAFFLDIGNVWTLKEDPERPLSKLSWAPEFDFRQDGTTFKTQDNVFNQLAVGSGFGTRVDFQYFIFRLDIGIPFRNPYPTYILGTNGEPTSQATHWRNFGDLNVRNLTFNIDLGYPF
ncbi:MAG: outer membrane protein insertion porin family, partial [Saprospiraceae bacterium]